VLASVEQYVGQNVADLARSAKLAAVIAVRPHRPAAARGPIEGACGANQQAAHTRGERGLVVSLDDEVHVVSLNRKVDQAEVGAGTGGDRGLEHRVKPRSAQGAHVGSGAKGDVEGEAALVLGAGTMQDDGAGTGLTPSAFAAAAPGANGERELALACHLD
jgi:hypothetical protein